jgi:hypothetical protein
MKSGSHFEKACYSSFDVDSACGRMRYSAQEFKKARLPGAVSSDYTKAVSLLDLKINIF